MQMFKRFIGGSLLVAGTSIGGGMLALPVMTSLGGFFPSIVIYFFCWLFMACTGLLFLELCLSVGKEVNMVSLARKTLGKPAGYLAILVYFFLFYCLSIAYVVAGGHFFMQISADAWPFWVNASLFVLLFAPWVYAGSSYVSNLNNVLMLGLFVSYFAFIYFGAQYVNTSFLERAHWSYAWMALPLSFTSFAYQGVIPSLVTFFDNDPKEVRKAIIVGSSIPFFVYVLWEWLVLGIVPLNGEHGLYAALLRGDSAIFSLKFFLKTPWLVWMSQSFAFFSLVTSFLGVSLGLMDFTIDALGLNPKQKKSRFFVSFPVFLPPLLISLANPHIFLKALNYAGGFGCAFLLGLLPVVMAWSARYHKKMSSPYRVGGGKVLLVLLLLFVCSEMLLECIQELGWGVNPSDVEVQTFVGES